MVAVFSALALVLLSAAARAQLDDYADDSWAAPQFDAIQRFQDDPLCLPCLTATELTVVPGIGRQTASRILAAVKGGVPTLEAIADTACLSIDQRILLYACTTFDCSCAPRLQSVRLRMRSTGADGVRPDHSSRVDVASDLGRTGGLVRQSADGEVVGGWLQANVGPISAAVGNYAVGGGLGLVHGAGGSFGRSMLARTASADVVPRLRPWTSTWLDGSLRGAAVIGRIQLGEPLASMMAAYSNKQLGSRREIAVCAGTTVEVRGITAGIMVQRLEYDATSVSTSSRVVPTRTRNLASATAQWEWGTWKTGAEFAIDDTLRTAWLVTFSHNYQRAQLLGAARWSHADIRNPYAAPTSSLSALGNEAGVSMGYRYREPGAWSIETTLDLHTILSRSYGRPLPSNGLDLLLDGDVLLGGGSGLVWRARYEVDEQGWRPDGSAATLSQRRHRATVRGQLTTRIARSVQVAARVDVRSVWYSLDTTREFGLLAWMDVRWTPWAAWQFYARATSFQAPSIESAAYSLETPVVGLPRTVAGSGRGTRFMAGCRFSPTTWFGVSAAYTEQLKGAQPAVRSVVVQLDVAYVNNRP